MVGIGQAVGAVGLLVRVFIVHGAGSRHRFDAPACHVRVWLHQLRRDRELFELKLEMRQHATRLRRELEAEMGSRSRH